MTKDEAQRGRWTFYEAVLLENLERIQHSLEKGAVVVFAQERIRIRPLPIQYEIDRAD